jgi:hypothetical protein
MVTTELTRPTAQIASDESHRSAVRAAGTCAAALVAVTAISAIVAAVDPTLVPSTPPHPTLHPTPAAAASILVNNARVLGLPYLLLAFRFDRVRWGRILGTALLVWVLGSNAVTVGLALGRWQFRLVPYLPHLPVEGAATGLAASVWCHTLSGPHQDPGRRAGAVTRGAVVIPAAITVVLLALAAAMEVVLTPHAG